MSLTASFFCSLLLLLNLQRFSAQPIRTGLTGSTGLTGTDIDILKMILDRLEESASKQSQWDQTGLSTDRDVVESMRSEEEEAAAEAAADGRAPPSGLDEAEIRKFFSAGNLKNLRKDLSSKTSSCFGRRMDRIGSLSPLGCNSLGKYDTKLKMGSDLNR